MRYHEPKSTYYEPVPNAEAKFASYARKLMRRKDAAVFVARENGKLVGYLIAKIEEGPPVFKLKKRGLITDAFVERGYRRRGIGRRLVERALDWFKAQNLESAELSVYVKNMAGRVAWKQMGFEEHAIVMRRKL